MARKYPIYKLMFVVMALLGFYSCERDDREPDLEMRMFTRLYVSFEQFGTSNTAGVQDVNLRLIYPADSSVFEYSLAHVSAAKGGGPILFSPQLQSLFQASANLAGINDTSVYTMSVGTTGVLSNIGRMGYYRFNTVRGLAYHAGSNNLFIVNGSGTNAGVYVVNGPRGRNREVYPVKKLFAGSARMWGAAYADNRLFMAKVGADAGLYVIDNVTTLEVGADSSAQLEIGNLMREIRINSARNLRGMSYDSISNVLAITEFDNGTTVGSGRILIFENFSNLVNQTEIEPTRIITGAATGLTYPVDVALDTRENGVYLYVADRTARTVSRFLISDEGNVAPDKVLSTGSQIPVGVALDTRVYAMPGQ